jgi:hypothetical protein
MEAEGGEITAGHTDAQLVSATELRWPKKAAWFWK